MVDAIAVRELRQLLPLVAGVDGVRVSHRTDVAEDLLLCDPDRGLVHLVDGDREQLHARLEQVLKQRLLRRRLRLFVLLVEEPEVLPVVEDEELGLVLGGPEEIFAQARAATDHLPELHIRLHRLGEDQVHHLGHVDAGVEHVDRDGDGQLVVGVFEVVDELLGLGLLVVDDAAEGGPVLGVELAEDLGEMHRVQVVPREDDGLADMLPRRLADAALHQRAPDGARGVLVEEVLVEVFAVVVDGLRLWVLVLELCALLGGHL